MSESSIPRIPNLDLANYRFILNNPKTPEFYDEARANLFICIEENSKCPNEALIIYFKQPDKKICRVFNNNILQFQLISSFIL